MSLAARIARIERQKGPVDPYAHLSDEDLEAMIAALTASIAQSEKQNEPENAPDER